MKKLNYALGIMMLGIFASCGGGDSDSVTLTVEPQLGELSDFISIKESDLVVNLKNGKEDGEAVKTIVAALPFTVTKGIQADSRLEFEFVVLDKDHNEIGELPSCYFDDEKYDWDNSPYNHILVPGNYRVQVEKTRSIESWKENNYQEDWDKIRKEGKFVEIKIPTRYLKFAPYNSPTVTSDSYSSDNNSNNYEGIEAVEGIDMASFDDDDYDSSEVSQEDKAALLSEFNEALNEYKATTKEALALAKKVKGGDEAASVELLQKSSECTALSNKILDLAKKLGDPTLMNKYQKINAEYVNGLH